jgi:hypothetical protein
MEFNIDKFRRKYAVRKDSIAMMWENHGKLSPCYCKVREQKAVATGFCDMKQ